MISLKRKDFSFLSSRVFHGIASLIFQHFLNIGYRLSEIGALSSYPVTTSNPVTTLNSGFLKAIIDIHERKMSWFSFLKMFEEDYVQKQPPKVSYKKFVLQNLAIFTGTHLCQSLLFNEVVVLGPAKSFKRRLWYRCFPVNFAKKSLLKRIPFLQNTSRGMLLYVQY